MNGSASKEATPPLAGSGSQKKHKIGKYKVPSTSRPLSQDTTRSLLVPHQHAPNLRLPQVFEHRCDQSCTSNSLAGRKYPVFDTRKWRRSRSRIHQRCISFSGQGGNGGWFSSSSPFYITELMQPSVSISTTNLNIATTLEMAVPRSNGQYTASWVRPFVAGTVRVADNVGRCARTQKAIQTVLHHLYFHQTRGLSTCVQEMCMSTTPH